MKIRVVIQIQVKNLGNTFSYIVEEVYVFLSQRLSINLSNRVSGSVPLTQRG